MRHVASTEAVICMNKPTLTAIALLAAFQVSAGVRIETVTRDVKTLAASNTQVLLVQDGKMRTNAAGRTNAVILKDTVLYIIDDSHKTYTEMDKATMKNAADRAGAAMKQLQERLKNMPPEQRAQMEKLMGDKVPGMSGGKPDTYTVADTGKSETVEGRKCHLWNLLRNQKMSEELCVVPFSSLPGKEDFQKSFRELAEAFSGMASGLAGVGESIKARNSIDGYPVRIRHFDDNGNPRGMESVLTKWAEEALPAATFDIPAGYTRKELPKVGN
jgi:hypothetical protein